MSQGVLFTWQRWCDVPMCQVNGMLAACTVTVLTLDGCNPVHKLSLRVCVLRDGELLNVEPPAVKQPKPQSSVSFETWRCH